MEGDAIKKCLEMLRVIISNPRMNERARKETFIAHLRTIFTNPEYSPKIDSLTTGAEEFIRTLPSRTSSSVHGFIDTRSGKLFIEFKANLLNANDNETAVNELKKYTAGYWTKKGVDSTFCCIATDILRWQIYRPFPVNNTNNHSYTADNVNLELIESLNISSVNMSEANHLVLLLERVLFQENLLVLDATNLKKDFGINSSRFELWSPLLHNIVNEAKSESEVNLAIELWKKYQSYNLGSNGFDINTYVNQIYLVLLSRLIVAALYIKENDVDLNDQLILDILNGNFFKTYLRLDNFVEADFFAWIARSPWAEKALPISRQIFHQLHTYDYSNIVKENVLRLIYDELIPKSQSNLLGQRSTPENLVAPIIKNISSDIENVYFLDPACGSGTFLTYFLKTKKEKLFTVDSDINRLLSKLQSSVQGIDVDPISVIISKASWAIAVSDLLKNSSSLVSIPVYHADSLFVAKEKGATTKIIFDKTTIEVPDVLFKNQLYYDKFIKWCNIKAGFISKEAKEQNRQINTISRSSIQGVLEAVLAEYLSEIRPHIEAIEECAIKLITELAKRIYDNRNGIWAFILRNSYRPSLFAGKFDLIATNPPWLAMSSIVDIPYKEELESLASSFKIKPSGSSFLHTEIATTFVLHNVSHFLKAGGKASFVMPRSIYDGDQHDKFRRYDFKSKVAFKIDKIWDLAKIENLFNVPSCVIFGTKTTNLNEPFKAIDEYTPDTLTNLYNEDQLSSEKLYLKQLGNKSAWVNGQQDDDNIVSSTHYQDKFKQGADLMPRTALFVDVLNEQSNQTTISIRTSEEEQHNPDNKKLKNRIFIGNVNSKFIYYTVTSKILLPMRLIKNDLRKVILPVKISNGVVEMLDNSDLINSGENDTAEWFTNIDNALGNEKLIKLINIYNKLTNQNFNGCKYIVHYGAGGAIPCACLQVLKDDIKDKFVADQTTYYYATNNEKEAWYLVGMLNSSIIPLKISAFQAKGSFGERHIHKLPLSLIPEFSNDNQDVIKLINISEDISSKVDRFISSNQYVMKQKLGSKRTIIRKIFKNEFAKLDRYAESILENNG